MIGGDVSDRLSQLRHCALVLLLRTINKRRTNDVTLVTATLEHVHCLVALQLRTENTQAVGRRNDVIDEVVGDATTENVAGRVATQLDAQQAANVTDLENDALAQFVAQKRSESSSLFLLRLLIVVVSSVIVGSIHGSVGGFLFRRK